MPNKVTETRIRAGGATEGHHHGHQQQDRCFGLLRPAVCGISWLEIIGATVLSLPATYWYRTTAIPWMHKHGVVSAMQRGGMGAGLGKLSEELGPSLRSWSSTVGFDVQQTLSSFLLWIAANPINFLFVGVALVGVVFAIDWVSTFLCCGHTHSHSHSHGHSHGGGKSASGAGDEPAKPSLAKGLQVDRQPSTYDIDADEAKEQAAAAGAVLLEPAKKSAKPGATRKVIKPEDTKGTVKRPRGKKPAYRSFHVSDPVLLLKELGHWPPPASTIVGGSPEAIEAARRREEEQEQTGKSSKSGKKTTTKKAATKHVGKRKKKGHK